MPQVGVKPRLPFIPLSDMNQVIRVAQVEFRKHRGMRKGFECGNKEWDGILVLNCDVVKQTVIYTWPQAAVLLGHEEEPCCGGRGGRPYDA